ncbi:MAG: hypothetical protein OQK04_16000 [Kangiellaceae bacterium]|nr:hypothetical protein [Kangiellaceae bacterium]MCW9000211.1 hypothetical protein [Kangiellaceae bacterium]
MARKIAHLLIFFIFLIGVFNSIGVGAPPKYFGSAKALGKSQEIPSYLNHFESNRDAKTTFESKLKNSEYHQMDNSDLLLVQIEKKQATESLSIPSFNLPSASFFKVRTQQYPDFFVRAENRFGEECFLKAIAYQIKIKPEWFLSTATRSSKRISGWKQSNLTANSKVYLQHFLTYI